MSEGFNKVVHELYGIASDVNALAARIDERRKLTAIIVAYDRAKDDPEVKLPSYLMAALETARNDVANDYANAMIKRAAEVPQWERNVRQGGKDIPVGM